MNTHTLLQQCFEALVGLIGPMLATLSTFGLLFFLDFKFTSILSIIPFLILSIGVDDCYILLAGLRQSNPSLPVTERIAETMSRSAASITVTSVTDILCFVIGYWSNLPAVSLFS